MLFRSFISLIIFSSFISCSNETNDSDGKKNTFKGGGDFYANNGNVRLAGTLFLPAGDGPFPVVVTVHGSGPVDRSQFAFLNSILNDAGIAVLNYDKRGVGESTGPFPNILSTAVLTELANDAIAWVNFLKNHEDIATNKIGLLGYSQAGWILPLAASLSTDLTFIVSVVGPTCTIGQEIYYSDLTAEQQFNVNRTVNGYTIDQLTQLTKDYNGVMGYDPAPDIRNIEIPVLFLYGELDPSIPTQLSVEILNTIIQDLNKTNFTIDIKVNANHGLYDVINNQQVPYFSNTGGINDWILTTTNSK